MAKKGDDTPAPPAPDPYATAGAQTQSNVNTAVANAILGNANEITPWGSVSYRQIGNTRIGGEGTAGGTTMPNTFGGKMAGLYGIGGTGGQVQGFDIPQFERTVTLSPEQQKLYDQQTQLGSSLNQFAIDQTGRLRDTLGKPIDFSDIPGVPTDFSEDRKRVEDALYSRINPQLDRDRDALENRLINQGFTRGSDAFNTEMDAANRTATDARMQAILAGGQEQSRLYGISSNARERAIQERLLERNQPINEITALMGSGQVTPPNFAQYNAPTMAGTDVMGAVYNSNAIQQQQYQQQQAREQQQQQAMMGGLFGLGSAALLGPLGGFMGGAGALGGMGLGMGTGRLY